MEITEVRIKLMPLQNDKLRAFCSITIDDDFVIRDLKVIEGTKGPFVAMPSRKLTERCPRCSGKNHHRASYCNDCGLRLASERAEGNAATRLKLHADIAHPINSRSRDLIQKRVLEHYSSEREKARDPNYKPSDLDVFDEDYLREVSYEDAPHTADASTGPGIRAPELGLGSTSRISEPVEARAQDGARRTLGREGNFGAGGRPRDGRGGGHAPRERDDPGPAQPSQPARTGVGRGADRVEDPGSKDRLTQRPLDRELKAEDNFGAGLFS